MARKKKHEEHENHERWLVSYADFITLLFAFFVVMYSISSVNEGKYRVLSDAIVAAFRSQEKSIRPIQVGTPTRAPKSTQMEMQQTPGIVKSPNPPIQKLDKIIGEIKTSGKLTKEEQELLELINKIGGLDALQKLRGLANLEGLDDLLDKAGLAEPQQQKLLSDQEVEAVKSGLQKLADVGGLEGLERLAELGGLQGLEELAKIGGLDGLDKLISAAGSEGARTMAKIADDIEQAMSGLIQQDLITVDRSDQWIEVEINTSILYPSGSAHLQPEAVPILKELARILRDFPNPMRIEGFTDNVPINTLVYPSNWELSAARASRVVRLFTDEDISPERMAAIGYGEYRPVANNDTAEGRSKNRRVVLVVLANHDVEDLFNSGVLKSGQRTAGFKQTGQTGEQPDKVEEIVPKQVPVLERAKDNAITKPQKTPSVIPKPQDKVEAKPKQPPLNDSAPKAAQPAIVKEAPVVPPVKVAEPVIPVKEVEPVITQPKVDRPPVFFAPRSSVPGIINEAAPSPLFMPPMKFAPPVSLPIEGATIGNGVKPGEQSSRIDISPRQATADDRNRESFTITPRKVPDEIPKPQNNVKAQQPVPAADTTPLLDQPAKRGITPESSVKEVEPAVTQSTVARPPVVFPSRSSAPGVIHEATSSPVFMPPIKFAPPISMPMNDVANGNTARPGIK